MPRAALLSIHARVEETEPTSWEDPSLVQVWGPRFSAYVVAERDYALFTVARLPDDPAARREWHELADRIEAFLDGRRMDCREVGTWLGRHPVSLRYAAPTGRAADAMGWARASRRYGRCRRPRSILRTRAASSPAVTSTCSGRRPRSRSRSGPASRQPEVAPTFEAIAGALTAVRTPVGEGWILAEDEKGFRAAGERATAAARLLPSGDTLFLLQGADRELLVADAARRAELWTPRVWPGALLVAGEVAGTWRRAGSVVTIQPWRRLTRAERDAVELETQSLPLPVRVRLFVCSRMGCERACKIPS